MIAYFNAHPEAAWVITVFALLLAIIGLVHTFNSRKRTIRKLEANNKELTELRARDKRFKDFLLTAVNDNLVDIAEIDLATYDFVFLAHETKTLSETQGEGKWRDFMDAIIPYLHAVDRPKVLDAFSEEALAKLEPGAIFTIKYRLAYDIKNSAKSQSGHYFWYQTRVRIWEEDGHRRAVVSTSDETEAIVEQRNHQDMLEGALRQAKQASQAKTTFLFNMSHDIRTPMNAIVGFTTIARKHSDDAAKVKECLDKIDESSTHLQNLINDILEMSRIEYGKVELEMAPYNIFTGVNKIVSMIQTEMEEKGLGFKWEVNVHDESVICDHLRITQVCLNLLGNAIKFTPRGGKVLFTVTQNNASIDGKTYYEWKISDTGIGMSKEFQKNMYGTFERERTSTESGIQGTGLGLSITKSLVELMDGSIRVESALNEGTTFYVTIPMELSEEEVKEESTAETPVYDFSDKRVLLVEDNKLNRIIAEELLVEEKIEVESVEDGAEAVKAVRDHEAGYYDLVLMDIQMPVMDGYQATRAIRRLEDIGKASVPIVAMTANAFAEDREKALNAGMQDHIPKPIDLEKLFSTMDHVWKRKQEEGK